MNSKAKIKSIYVLMVFLFPVLSSLFFSLNVNFSISFQFCHSFYYPDLWKRNLKIQKLMKTLVHLVQPAAAVAVTAAVTVPNWMWHIFIHNSILWPKHVSRMPLAIEMSCAERSRAEHCIHERAHLSNVNCIYGF